ncbi:MFS transporter [Sphingomonas sp. CA1-15]|uniref:MFS transporter n=1 Tax=Sphingomonas immobilis TaxID=3063997 RepID=A0ABT8ZVJ2_9SPHN|nr:MFS transporter [Sphingomonas sp. CA1-15]
MVLITTINLMDRQLPFIMAEPIRKEFGLNDTQLGLLGGFAFSLVYALGALPLARLADRTSRRTVLSACLAVWSLFTGLGALATGFGFLMATRAGVAIGEAGAAPSSHSMIADLFPDRRRALAMALNTAGIPLGVLFGMAIGGFLLTNFTWRQVLVMAAVPGLLLALVLMAFVREPQRIGAVAGVAGPGFAASVRILAGQPSFRWLCAGATLGAFSTSAGAAFGPAFLIRAHGLSIGQAGLAFGLMLGAGGVAGGISAGLLASRIAAKDPRWLMRIPAIGAAIQMPLYCASWLIPDLRLMIVIQAAGWLIGSSYLSLSYTATQAIAAPRMRAFSSAAIQLVLNLLGNVLGPIVAGMLSDRITIGPGGGLGIALSVCGLGMGLACLSFWRASRLIGGDIVAARALAAA